MNFLKGAKGLQTLDYRPESDVLVLHSWNNPIDCTAAFQTGSVVFSLVSILSSCQRAMLPPSRMRDISRVDILDRNQLVLSLVLPAVSCVSRFLMGCIVSASSNQQNGVAPIRTVVIVGTRKKKKKRERQKSIRTPAKTHRLQRRKSSRAETQTQKNERNSARGAAQSRSHGPKYRRPCASVFVSVPTPSLCSYTPLVKEREREEKKYKKVGHYIFLRPLISFLLRSSTLSLFIFDISSLGSYRDDHFSVARRDSGGRRGAPCPLILTTS